MVKVFVKEYQEMKAVIFDLDGVLVFTDQFHYKAWKKLADDMGIYFDETINNRLRGVSRMDSLEIILEKYKGEPLSTEKKERLAEEKNNNYQKLLETMTKEDVSDEVRSTLKELKQRGYLLAIGSSSKNAKFILDKTKLTDMFDAVSDGTIIARSKPDPEVFLKAAELLGIAPEKCLVVEDAVSGIDAAKAAGMTAAGTGDARNYEKADINLKQIGDILDILI